MKKKTPQWSNTIYGDSAVLSVLSVKISSGKPVLLSELQPPIPSPEDRQPSDEEVRKYQAH